MGQGYLQIFKCIFRFFCHIILQNSLPTKPTAYDILGVLSGYTFFARSLKGGKPGCRTWAIIPSIFPLDMRILKHVAIQC